MDFAFESIRKKFALLVVVVICIKLIEGMGACKFQKQFPTDLETGCWKNSKVNVTAEYSDCYDVYKDGSTDDGIYKIKPQNWPGSPFEVLCNMSDGGGWTVFQRRVDGSENFFLDWENYKQGFGNLSGEFWLGNEKIYFLTNQKNYELRIEFVDKEYDFYNLTYDMFCLGSESDKYRLKTLGNFMGKPDEVYDYMRTHENQPFFTKDKDNGGGCSAKKTGAWWYTTCGTANLNGNYFGSQSTSIYVRNSGNDEYKYNLLYTEMKVRPVN